MDTMRPFETLRQESSRLISSFLQGKEPAFIERHAHALDDYFRDSFGQSIIGPKMGMARNPYAIIALGGYGRTEQCIHSDVDLLFLFKKRVPDEAEGLIREVVYPLWDIGLEIGHATRSIKECMSLAANDIEVLTSLLDARFICGASLLYSEMMEQLRNRIVSKNSKKIIAQLVKANQGRHAHYGDSAYLLEPNLKEGQGGIRDYHTMLWIARVQSDLTEPRGLEYFGYLTHGGFEALSETLAFLWQVRNHLHHLAGRKCDRLHFEYQTRLAGLMDFHRENGQQPVEKFLGKLHGRMESLKQQYQIFVREQGYEKTKGRKRKTPKETDIDGLWVNHGALHFISSEEILRDPGLLMKIFLEGIRLKIPLSAEARQLVKEFAYLVDDDFRSSALIAKLFENILLSPEPMTDVLQEMLDTGLLAQYIPQFRSIINMVQYDEYHLYPVDKHSLLTVKEVKDFRTQDGIEKAPLCHTLYKELRNKRILLWAALLHDIGKGEPGKGHSKRGAAIVGTLLERFDFRPKEIETISFLIEEHLLLPKTATRRDINDQETAIFCARSIKEISRLKMLYLLSVADSISTGPKAWNTWTSSLMRSLFLKTLRIMEGGELATNKAIRTVERKKEDLLSSSNTPQAKKELETHLMVMSPRYLLYVPAADILEHIKLYEGLGDDSVVWKVTGNSEPDTRIVTVCAVDQPGLFSKIAGTFTLNSLDILDSQIYTWRNNIALDIFRVKAPADRLFEDERWARAQEHLKSALSGRLDLAAALRQKMNDYRSGPHLTQMPNQVVIDNESSSFFTLIEVFTYDFPGLLFGLTDALFRCGLDIWVAKIATKVDQVVDIFYVRDFDGQKVDTDHQEIEIKEAIASVLPGALPELEKLRDHDSGEH